MHQRRTRKRHTPFTLRVGISCQPKFTHGGCDHCALLPTFYIGLTTLSPAPGHGVHGWGCVISVICACWPCRRGKRHTPCAAPVGISCQPKFTHGGCDHCALLPTFYIGLTTLSPPPGHGVHGGGASYSAICACWPCRRGKRHAPCTLRVGISCQPKFTHGGCDHCALLPTFYIGLDRKSVV